MFRENKWDVVRPTSWQLRGHTWQLRESMWLLRGHMWHLLEGCHVNPITGMSVAVIATQTRNYHEIAMPHSIRKKTALAHTGWLYVRV